MTDFAPSVLPPLNDYDALRRQFSWRIPAAFNIAVAICDRWAVREPRRVAIVQQHADGRSDAVDYGTLRETSNRLANTLRAHGIARGDRVALLLPKCRRWRQSISRSTSSARSRCRWRRCLVRMRSPFGCRIGRQGADHGRPGARQACPDPRQIPALALVLSVGGKGEGAPDFHDDDRPCRPTFLPEATAADDPAMMIYTSGTTGPPKGALEPHRVLLGHLPASSSSTSFFRRPATACGRPRIGLGPAGCSTSVAGLYYGVPVVARRFERFDPEEAFALMAQTGVRNAFIPRPRCGCCVPPASRSARHAVCPAHGRLRRRSAGAETYEWGKSARPRHQRVLRPDRMQQVWRPARRSACQRRAPSASRCPAIEVAVIEGREGCARRTRTGQIAVRAAGSGDVLEYWERPDATREKFIGDWMTTGDQGIVDEEGYISFVGRDDE